MSTLQNNYTSRDFESIYADLLAAAKQLTARWDPSESNESDPGVVLLKLGALLADKANYAVDQGLLQLFPTTVSQRPAAEMLFESLGYNMRWYQSAYAPLEISYGGSLASGQTIKLPKYDTKVASDDGKFVFSLVEDASFDGGEQASRRRVSVSAVEGAIRQLTLGGDSVITLHHLDNYNRVYLPEQMIAQNGIFVWGAEEGSEQWTQVDNLQAQSMLARVYKFGTNRSGSCYLEFPAEVASIIGTGLRIYYAVSAGAAGNVNANTLTKFYGTPPIISKGFVDSEFTYTEDDFRILNPSGTTGGSDPQTIDDAYQEYLRIMGTFNTLVSERDYEAYLYRMPGPVNKYWVSNIRVNDRTDDLTWSTYVKVLGDSGATDDQLQVASELVQVQDSRGEPVYDSEERPVYISEDRIKPYEIRLRPLEYVENLASIDRYNETFDISPSRGRLMGELESAAVSMISLQEKPMREGEGYLILNKFAVKGVLYTRKPVSDTEGEELLNKVRLALFRKFNAREVSFGVPVEWSDVRDTIESADPNIDYVVLDDLVYTPYMLYLGSGGTSQSDLLGDWYQLPIEDSRPEGRRREELLARMVVSGRLQLFDFEGGFSLQYGTKPAQGVVGSETTKQNIGPLHELVSITTESTYTVGEDVECVVRPGDNIVFEAPNFITDVSYASYVKWQANNATGNPIVMVAGQIYKVLTNLTLTLADTTISSGSFIKPSFEWTIGTGTSDGYLAVDQTVEVVRPNMQSFDPNAINCMWFRDQGENVLFGEEEASIVLAQGQWFVYKTPTSAALNFLGAGTKIERDTIGSKVAQRFDVSVEELQAQGSAQLASSMWYQPADTLTFTEQEIVTLGQGTSFKVVLDGSDDQLNNTSKTLVEGSYTVPGESEQTLAPRPQDYGWSVRSRLNINASPTVPMLLGEGQTMEIEHRVSTSSLTEVVKLSGASGTEEQINVRFSQGFALVGGSNVDLGVTNVLTGETAYPISAYPYCVSTASTSFPASRDVYSFYGVKLEQVKVGSTALNRSVDAGTKVYTGTDSQVGITWKARFRLYAGFVSDAESVPSYTIDLVYGTDSQLYYGEYQSTDQKSASIASDQQWSTSDISKTADEKNRLFTLLTSKTLRFPPMGLYTTPADPEDLTEYLPFVYDNTSGVQQRIKVNTDTDADYKLFIELGTPYWEGYTSLIPVQAPASSAVEFVDLGSGDELQTITLLSGSGKWSTIKVQLTNTSSSPVEPAAIIPFTGKLTPVVADTVYTLQLTNATRLLSNLRPIQIAQLKPSVVYETSQEGENIGATEVTRGQVSTYIQNHFAAYNLAYTPSIQELMQDSQASNWSPLSPSSLWDQRNLLSAYTLPCLDTSHSSLTVANASRKRGM